MKHTFSIRAYPSSPGHDHGGLSIEVDQGSVSSRLFEAGLILSLSFRAERAAEVAAELRRAADAISPVSQPTEVTP